MIINTFILKTMALLPPPPQQQQPAALAAGASAERSTAGGTHLADASPAIGFAAFPDTGAADSCYTTRPLFLNGFLRQGFLRQVGILSIL